MKKLLLIITLLIINPAAFATETDSLLIVLKRQMAKRQNYDDGKENRINHLKYVLAHKKLSDDEVYNLNDKLILEYIPYNFKQTLLYINKNIELASTMGNAALLNKAKLYQAATLSSSGNLSESRDLLAQINKDALPSESVNRYYYTQMWLYYRLHFYGQVSTTKQKYKALYTAYADTLLSRLNPESEMYLSIKETQFRDAGNFLKNRETNLRRLKLVRPGADRYSSTTFFLAQSYLPENNIDQYKKYLILSALSDIKASVKDNASLAELAVQFYKEGNIELAHHYINFAFEDASFYDSRLRLSSLSSVLPLINKSYETAVQKQKERLQLYIILISVLGLLLLLMLFYIWKQVSNLSNARKNLQDANDSLNVLNAQLTLANSELKGLYTELSDTNRVKEYYIGNLLNLCSEYLDKLDVYRKTVKKMIIAKQISELLEKTKSAEFIEYEIEAFYKNFDTIFLHIYPDFVNQFNNLLLENERIVLKKGELLTTELRIFALIRLGITDSSKIAKLLRYSVNTIYNYRVKTKNKAAVSRDDFENLVIKIGSPTGKI
jgi:hypothetical protein